MWDILDLTSSSSFPSAADMTGSATQHGKITPNEKKSPEQELDVDIHGEGHGQEPGTSNFLVQGEPLLGGASHPVDEPVSDWPFSQRVGNNPLTAVPDIPDWMIFGDFTEHL